MPGRLPRHSRLLGRGLQPLELQEGLCRNGLGPATPRCLDGVVAFVVGALDRLRHLVRSPSLVPFIVHESARLLAGFVVRAGGRRWSSLRAHTNSLVPVRFDSVEVVGLGLARSWTNQSRRCRTPSSDRRRGSHCSFRSTSRGGSDDRVARLRAQSSITPPMHRPPVTRTSGAAFRALCDEDSDRSRGRP